jgi:hypothetical protein
MIPRSMFSRLLERISSRAVVLPGTLNFITVALSEVRRSFDFIPGSTPCWVPMQLDPICAKLLKDTVSPCWGQKHVCGDLAAAG